MTLKDSKPTNSSYLPGGVGKTTTEDGSTYSQTVYHERTTEIEGLRPRAHNPSYIAWQTCYWARIASQPGAFPNVNDKPLRAQSGQQLLEWVAKRVGLSVDIVDAYLRQVDRYWEREA
jgi:hypothetical protein